MGDISRDITHNRPPSLSFARAFEPTKILGSSDASRTALEAREAADSTEWYTTTGQALITTIAINVVAPRVPDLVEYLILGPWRRRPASAAAMITQRQLNKNWKGGQTTLHVVPAGAVALDIKKWAIYSFLLSRTGDVLYQNELARRGHAKSRKCLKYPWGRRYPRFRDPL